VGTLGLFARTATFPFTNLDDLAYVVQHPRVVQGLVSSNVAWAFTTFDQFNWHPLTWMSFMLDVSLFGVKPGPMHLINAGLHAANVVLLFAALRLLTAATGKSALVAALFAIHPAHVESVAWISERKDVLSILFGLLALIAYSRYARKPGILRYLVLSVAFAASLMAKSMLVTLPFLLLLLDVWPMRRVSLRVLALEGDSSPEVPKIGPGRAILEKLPLLVLSAVASWITFAAQSGGGAVLEDPGHQRYANAIVSYPRYVGKLLWPVDLAVFYPIRHAGLPTSLVVASLSGILLVTVAALLVARRAPWIAVGWLWFLGTLVPVIGFVQVGSQAMADRYTYFPSIGLFVAIIWGLGELPWKRFESRASVLALAILAVLGVLCHRQIGLWADDERLFRHALSVTEENVRAHELLANVLLDRGKPEEARAHFLEAVRILPNSVSLTSLGSVSLKLGRADEAERAFRFALMLDPDRDAATLALAGLLVSAGRTEESAGVLQRAAHIWPRPGHSSISQRVELGAALVDLGRFDEGIGVIESARTNAPDNPEILSSLSEAYFHRGDVVQAERFALGAVAGGAKSGGAFLVLGATRTSRGDFSGAIDALEQAVRNEPDEPFRRLPLADAQAKAGRMAEACANWVYVSQSPRALASDRERATRDAKASGCQLSF
jgi:tetratricopeptide (TPR) repeat protein